MIVLIILGICRYLDVRKHQTDPNWKLAEQIYKMENALKEVDEDYECKSLSKVTPYSYTDSEENIITYYCCQTSYLSDESGEYTDLNTDAISMVIDFAQIQNRRECTVNVYEALWRKVCSNPMNNYISCKRPRMHFAPVAVALFRRCMPVRSRTESLQCLAGDAFVSVGAQSRWSTGKKPPLWSVGDSIPVA